METFLKSETGPLGDTSLYVDWPSPQWSPITQFGQSHIVQFR